jgi:3,4-dihydroxy-2-butanone 4-phosphate synthase
MQFNLQKKMASKKWSLWVDMKRTKRGIIAENNIRVLKRVHDMPENEDDVDLPFKSAKLLTDKGVLVGLENSGAMERMNTRNLPFYGNLRSLWP